MNDRAFIDTIIANPKDDGPRLVYADWLEERGDPRAEFIRLQVELAVNLKPDFDIEEHIASLTRVGYRTEHLSDWNRLLSMSRRCDELLSKHRREWMPNLNNEWVYEGNSRESRIFHSPDSNLAYPDPGVGLEFARGFPELLTCRWEEWAKHHEALRSAIPVSRVTLTTQPQTDRLDHTTPHLKFDEFLVAGAVVKTDRSGHGFISMQPVLEARWPGVEFVLPREEAPRFDMQGLPLPIIHSDFHFDLRTIAASRMRDGGPVLLPGPVLSRVAE